MYADLCASPETSISTLCYACCNVIDNVGTSQQREAACPPAPHPEEQGCAGKQGHSGCPLEVCACRCGGDR